MNFFHKVYYLADDLMLTDIHDIFRKAGYEVEVASGGGGNQILFIIKKKNEEPEETIAKININF